MKLAALKLQMLKRHLQSCLRHDARAVSRATEITNGMADGGTELRKAPECPGQMKLASAGSRTRETISYDT